jgi:hypothetical protein
LLLIVTTQAGQAAELEQVLLRERAVVPARSALRSNRSGASRPTPTCAVAIADGPDPIM